MKILFRLSFLVLVPIIGGLALVLSGHSIGVWILAIGTPAVMIVLVIAGLIMMITGKLFEKPQADNATSSDGKPTGDEKEQPSTDGVADRQAEARQADVSNSIERAESEHDSAPDDGGPSQKEIEQSAINAVNDSVFYSSKLKLAEYEAQHIAEGMKHTTKKGCALAITIVLLVVIDVVLAVVFAIKQIWVGAIICAALFGVTIIASIITVIIREAISMHGNIRKAKKFVCGKVISCIISSMVTSDVHKSARINSVVYNVTVKTDAAEYTAFSKQFHETDETVVVAVIGKKLSKLIEEDDLENLDSDLVNKYNECVTTGGSVTISK